MQKHALLYDIVLNNSLEVEINFSFIQCSLISGLILEACERHLNNSTIFLRTCCLFVSQNVNSIHLTI